MTYYDVVDFWSIFCKISWDFVFYGYFLVLELFLINFYFTAIFKYGNCSLLISVGQSPLNTERAECMSCNGQFYINCRWLTMGTVARMLIVNQIFCFPKTNYNSDFIDSKKTQVQTASNVKGRRHLFPYFFHVAHIIQKFNWNSQRL